MGAPFCRQTVLPNGLRIVTKNFSGVKTFSLAIVIRRGSKHDPLRLAGLAHFLEHAVHRGTKRWTTSSQVNERFEIKGLSENAQTSTSFTSFYILEAITGLLNYSFDFLSEIVLNPLLDESAITAEKGVIIDEHFTYKDDPGAEARELLNRMLYVHSPLGRRTEGTQETIKRIQRSDLVKMHQRYYIPNNMIIVAIGDIQHQQVVKLARHFFGHIPRKPLPRETVKIHRISSQHLRRICRPALNAAYLNIGARFTDLTTKEQGVLEILSTVLGGHTLSRLFKLIRTDLGKAYMVDSGVEDFLEGQQLNIDTAPLPKDLEKIRQLIYATILTLKEKGISTAELRLAKTFLVNDRYREIKYSEDFLHELIATMVHNNPEYSFLRAIPIIRSVTPADVQKFLDQHWRPEDFRIAIIAPKKKTA